MGIRTIIPNTPLYGLSVAYDENDEKECYLANLILCHSCQNSTHNTI